MYQTRPVWSTIGLCELAWLPQMDSSPQYGDGCSGGVLRVLGVSSSRTGARKVVATFLTGSSIGKSSVLSSGDPYTKP